MSSAEYLGLVAGLFTTFSFIPQIMRVYKLKSAREISLLFNTSMLLGSAMWLIYGIVFWHIPIIIWNCFGITLNSWLLFAKLKYGRVKSI